GVVRFGSELHPQETFFDACLDEPADEHQHGASDGDISALVDGRRKRCNDDARVNRVANDSIGPGVHHMMTFLERDGTRPELTEVNARPPAKQETGASQ